MISIDIRLKRESKVYYEDELLIGGVQFQCPAEAKHDGITLTLEGVVNLQLSTKTAGIFDAFYNSVKPITLLNTALELAAPGKLSVGISEFHFELPLVCNKEPRILYETYHGVFINVNYQLRCDVKRSFLAKSLQKTQQFCIQYKPKSIDVKAAAASEVNFSVSPESLQKNAKERIVIPRFLITGRLDQTECCITRPLTGHIIVQHTEAAIKSIELQLVRVETCGCTEGYSKDEIQAPKDATEIQAIQIADGNISPKLEIPIYMILPRLFTCPTLLTKNFKIEFELNILIIFKDDYFITENFPIIVRRTQAPHELQNFSRCKS